MKTLRHLIILLTLGLLASVANADFESIDETGSAGNPEAEAGLACDALGIEYCDLLFDFKYNYPDCKKPGEDGYDPSCIPNEGGAGSGAVSSGDYTVADFIGEPASSLVSWDLVDPAGYGLFAIAVKTGTKINWYGSTDGAHTSGTDLQVFTHASENKNSISHISFFVKAFDGGPGPHPIPEPGTLGLLGLGLLGFGLRRRSKI